MKTLINIDNYEEIMFRLVEDDFDESTRIDLLRQIEADALFKFEWESWQKTKFVDPLENYSIESRELTDKIILIAEPQTSGRKRVFYYWTAAASILILIASLFLLTADFNSKPKQDVKEVVLKSHTPIKTIAAPVQNNNVTIAITDRKQPLNQKTENKSIPVVIDSNKIVATENTLAEIPPKAIDSIQINSNELVKVTEEKPRYTITISTSPIDDNVLQNHDLAQHRKVKIGKVLTGTRLFLQRKENGEPDKIIIMGDENNYLCINLNYTEK